MSENTRKKFNIEIKIRNYLTNLENNANGVYNYIISNPMTTDVDEILCCLESIPEITRTIDKLIEKLEVLYENEQL